MNDAVNKALTLRKEEKLRFGTTVMECVQKCESQCEEFEREKDIVPERDYQELTRVKRLERRSQGLPASRGPPPGVHSDDSVELSDDDYVEPSVKDSLSKSIETRKGHETTKKASIVRRKPRNEKKGRKAGKGKAKAVVRVDDKCSDVNADDEGQGPSDGTPQDGARPGPISDEAQSKINALRDQIIWQVKEIADETGKPSSWVEKQLFGRCARQCSRNPWNAFLSHEQYVRRRA